MTLKYYLAFIKINNFSNLQKSEQLIARTSRNSTRHYFNFQNKLNRMYFQNIRTPDSGRSSTNYFCRKSHTDHDHEKLLKVIPFDLWVKQFCRAGNSLKIPINVKQQVFPTPPTSTLGFQTMETLTKSTCTQVK